MRMSEQVNEIAKALATAQGEIRPVAFDSTSETGKYSFKYSSLACIWDTIRDALSKNGIFVTQDLTSTETGVNVETTIMHSSGQWIVYGPLFMPAKKIESKYPPKDGSVKQEGFTAQDFGSSGTYAKRYALSAALGLTSQDEDDDANTASGTEAKVTQKETKSTAPIKPTQPGGMSEAQFKFLTNLASSMTSQEIMEICKNNKVSELKFLTPAQASQEINHIQEMRKKG